MGAHVYVDPSGKAHRYEGHDAPLGSASERAFEEADAKLDALAGELDPEAPWAHPDARELDSITFEAWLRAEVADQMAQDLLRSWLAGGFLAKPANTFSLLQGLWMIAGAGGTYELFEPDQCLATRVVGGSQLIPIRLAERLGDRVLLEAPARDIRWSDVGVEVDAETVTVSARAAIVAVPPNLTEAIRFRPALPAWRQRLAQSLSQGSITKVLAVYEQPFWREEGLSGQGFAPYELVRELYDNSPPSASAGVLVTFLAGENAERAGRMSAGDRRAAVLEGMAKYVGPRALEAVDLIETDWSAEEWTRGAYGTSYGPGGPDPLRRGPAPVDRADPLGLHRHRRGRPHPHGGRRPLRRARRQGLPRGRSGLAESCRMAVWPIPPRNADRWPAVRTAAIH